MALHLAEILKEKNVYFSMDSKLKLAFQPNNSCSRLFLDFMFARGKSIRILKRIGESRIAVFHFRPGGLSHAVGK